MIGIGTSRFVLYREVSFIRSVLYRRFHCIRMRNLYVEQSVWDIGGGGMSLHPSELKRISRSVLQLWQHWGFSFIQIHHQLMCNANSPF